MPEKWDKIMEAAVALRRELHSRPELTWSEHETARRLRDELTRAGIDWRECAGTGTIATLAGEAKGAHVALRGDIDALPIREDTHAKWASKNEGCMHACGHDGHTATLMATAWWLKQHESSLSGPVSLFFQPAEEGGHGALRMIEDGALKDIDAIFGWHNWPAIPFGNAVCPDGAVMAANGSFQIRLKGRGGHASQPEACRDPVLAASTVVQALQQIVSRRMAPQQAVVVSVTSVRAESADTVVPDEAVMRGSFRIADNRLKKTVEDLIVQISQDAAGVHGVIAEVEIFPRYAATVNEPGQAEYFRKALQTEFGDTWHHGETPVPIMASEDFSYYLKKIPGAYALIGAGDGEGHEEPCHSPRYDFNDKLIPKMTRVYSLLVNAPVPYAERR